MEVVELLKTAINKGASDIFVVAGAPLTAICNGTQMKMDTAPLTPAATKFMIDEIYSLSDRPSIAINSKIDDDFSFSLPSLGRFRINIFRQRGSFAAVIKVIKFGLPNAEEIGVPETVLQLSDNTRGLVIVTGESGCGKTTTLACMVDRINKTKHGHIITLEDPIEYVHRHNQCIVSQRELSVDIPDYISGLRSATREKPRVILLGEMKGEEVVESALDVAEAGVLVLTSMHTDSVVSTVGRVIEEFPAAQQQKVRNQLAGLLKGVVCQKLISDKNGKIIPVFEVMKTTPVIQDMIRNNSLAKIEAVMQTSQDLGMSTMDGSLLKLLEKGVISKETVINNCVHREVIKKTL